MAIRWNEMTIGSFTPLCMMWLLRNCVWAFDEHWCHWFWTDTACDR